MFDYTQLDIKASDFEIISFDIFDTIFHRVCHPDVVIEQTCYDIADQLNIEPETVVKARYNAVKELRSKTASRVGADHEYHFDDLAEAFCEYLERRDAIKVVEKSLRHEINREKMAVFPNVEMISFAKKMRLENKRLVAISDMYLSSRDIHALLSEVGAGDLFDLSDIYVSGAFGVNKHSSKLFDLVVSKLRVDAGNILHIGDNAHSDIKMAARAGLATANYNADRHHERYGRFRSLRSIASRTGEALHEAGLSALCQDSVHDRIASHIAPVLCHFALSLQEEATQAGVSDLWFMARDGYLLKSLYDQLAATKPGGPTSHYFFVSRKAVTFASSDTYGIREAFLAEWNGESRRVRTMLAPLKLSESELVRLCDAFGFASPDEHLDHIGDPRFVRMLKSENISERMQRECSDARQRLMTYLDRSGFLSSTRPAVVDVGWAGQIQEALSFAVNLEGVEKAMHGYYMGLRKLGGLRRLAGQSMKGLTYDCSDHSWQAESIIHAVEVFEDSCRATHGTVTGYDQQGMPLLANEESASYRAELAGNPRIRALQASIVRYAERWFKLAAICSIKATAVQDFSRDALTSLARFPSKEEAVYFNGIDHALDSGNDIVLSSGLVKFTLNPFTLRKRMRTCRWKAGALTSMPMAKLFQVARAITAMRAPCEDTPPGEQVQWSDQNIGRDLKADLQVSVHIPQEMEIAEKSKGHFYVGKPRDEIYHRVLNHFDARRKTRA